MTAVSTSYGQDFSGRLSQPNTEAPSWLWPSTQAVGFDFQGLAGDPLNIEVFGLEDAGSVPFWSCFFAVAHESGQVLFQGYGSTDPLSDVLPMDGIYHVLIPVGSMNGDPAPNQDRFQGHLFLPVSLRIDPQGPYLIGESIRLTPTIPARFTATLPGMGRLQSGVTVLDQVQGESKDVTLSVRGGGVQEEITLGTIDHDAQDLLPGASVTGQEWNGNEWHFYGQGGEDVHFELKAGSVYQVFGLTLSPLDREGSGALEWLREQYGHPGETIQLHAVLPEAGAYRIDTYFAREPG